VGARLFRRPIVADWRQQLDFTTKIFRARGLHLDDRHVREKDGTGFSASIVDLAATWSTNHHALRDSGDRSSSTCRRSRPRGGSAVERPARGARAAPRATIGTIKAYVLVEHIEGSFQLMEIRAVLGRHFVGFNTGRWDYINSVADAMVWDPGFVTPISTPSA